MSSIQKITPEIARSFREQFRTAREKALNDAEAFEGIIHVVERLGQYLHKNPEKAQGLGAFHSDLTNLTKESPLASFSEELRSVHTPFSKLYWMVASARNDAVHIGAFARHPTTHAIELALILEDALSMKEERKKVTDFMVRDPICAHRWEPISFIRQKMLMSSFSYLPVNCGDKYYLISDFAIAQYLPPSLTRDERKSRLATSLNALMPVAGESDIKLHLTAAEIIFANSSIDEVVANFRGTPMLVLQSKKHRELVGILTAFDLI